MLQDYYFNSENNPRGRESHYDVLTRGLQYLYGAAFCASDDEALIGLRPFVNSVMNGEVPEPIYQEGDGGKYV